MSGSDATGAGSVAISGGCVPNRQTPACHHTTAAAREKDIGKRLGLDKARVAENRFEELDQPATALYELFQLLISNHDYSVLKGPEGSYCCHNSVMYTREESAEKRIPIPYDFDMSGFVNANYAAPPSHLPIRLVRTRFYRGLCQPDDVMQGQSRTCCRRRMKS